MRTPVLLVAGQGARTEVVDLLLRTPGTLAVGYGTDGHVVLRNVTEMRDEKRLISQWPIELAGGCVTCTIRNDLLILLRRLHRREDVQRIVVELMDWIDPEPICTAINELPVVVGPGYIDGPAGRDVVISGVLTTVDAGRWKLKPGSCLSQTRAPAIATPTASTAEIRFPIPRAGISRTACTAGPRSSTPPRSRGPTAGGADSIRTAP